MDEKTKKKIMEMHKKGMTIYAIAKQLGLSQTGVKYVLDPKYREYMSQISHKRYSKAQNSQPNNTISSSDAAWLSQHRQNVERRNRILKGTGVFFYCFAFVLAIAIFAALSFVAFALIFAFVALAFAFVPALLATPDKYAGEAVVGSISGLIIGIVIALIYLVPMASIAQYPISMQVFYPNHPNMTITQNCTAFSVSSSGYLNGQPINPENTTTCNLPSSMDPNALFYEPFNCNINGNSITCNATLPNVTWQGTILNVSKR